MIKNRKRFVFIVAAVFALVVFAAFLLDRCTTRSDEPSGSPGGTFHKILPDEMLIKGCLFDSGFIREDVHSAGKEITVYTSKTLSPQEIKVVFAPLEAVADIEVTAPMHARISFDGSSWDIVFQRWIKRIARLAIIVDDMGLSMGPAKQLADLDADLTFSVMPLRAHTKDVAEYLYEKGKEVMLHLPMEGNGKDPGPGALYHTMNRDKILEVTRNNIMNVPHVSGVNNHMGSVATADYTLMRIVCEELKRSGLFFIDSLTTHRSVCRKAAEDTGLPFNARDVFLDNEQDEAYIKGQLDKLITISMKHSQAIGICHPHPATIAVLAREIPKMKDLGIEIVRVSAFVND
ncbi:MAG TPA: divergent polysaccharide deacetylase family protein [Deltaproteobacteria bacterium]|nr:divergent polysaccharide deacetylase family protein [Deltaproteobacteria bacterium]